MSPNILKMAKLDFFLLDILYESTHAECVVYLHITLVFMDCDVLLDTEIHSFFSL